MSIDTPANIRFDLSEDRKHLVAHRVYPGAGTLIHHWDFSEPLSDQQVEEILANFAQSHEPSRGAAPGQRDTLRRVGRVILGVHFGPPTWWWPRAGRDGQAVYVGWLRFAVSIASGTRSDKGCRTKSANHVVRPDTEDSSERVAHLLAAKDEEIRQLREDVAYLHQAVFWLNYHHPRPCDITLCRACAAVEVLESRLREVGDSASDWLSLEASAGVGHGQDDGD